MDHREDLEGLLAELAAQTGARHPSANEWIAYSEDRLPVEERARLDLHRQRCGECRELVDELMAFPHRPGPAMSEGEREIAWQSLRHRLAEDSGAAEPALRRSPLSRPLRRAIGGAAAALCLAVGLWGLWAQQRAQRILEYGPLTGDLALITLVEVTPPLRGANDKACVPGDRNAALALILQRLAVLGPDEPLVAEVIDRQGIVRLRREGLRRQSLDGAREILSLPASRLQPGPHTLRLSAPGVRGTDTFLFEICSS